MVLFVKKKKAVAAAGLTLVDTQTALISSNGANQDITFDTAPLEDDIVIVGVASDGSMASRGIITSGYTDLIAAGNDDPGRHLAHKVMGATPDTLVNITGGNFRHSAINIHIWRGVDTASPVSATVDTGTAGTGFPNPGSHTTENANAIRIAWGAMDDDEGASFTAPTDFINLAAIATTAGAGDGATVWMASKFEATTGALDPDAFGSSTGSDANAWAHFSLNPA